MKGIWILILLSIALLFVLTSCTSQTTVPQSPTSPAPTQQVPTLPVAPTQAPATTPKTVTSATTSTQQSNELTLKIVSVTSPVGAGASATLVAQTLPNADCDIDVYYKSGASTASGLYPQKADGSGKVSWKWKVGTRTTAGSWQIVVKATYGGKTVTQSTYFTVR